MIGSVEGTVTWKEERSLIVSATGVGYVVFVTTETALWAQVGSPAMFYTHLAVRDDALDLYGFRTRDELHLFRLLIGISGIGPKSAQNVLALADTKTILRAISTGDSGYLTKVAGIGKKLAEKIVHELKDKVASFGVMDAPVSIETEAIEALLSLGYATKDTRDIVRTLATNHTTTESLIHNALRQLGGRPQ